MFKHIQCFYSIVCAKLKNGEKKYEQADLQDTFEVTGENP
jgi:hypothetical protein